MAIGPLGNIVYINQNTQVVASKATDQLNRYEIQNFMSAEAMREKEKVVAEVRPAEESHGIDPDRENNQPQEDAQKEHNKQEQDKEKEGPHSDTPNLHILDIKV